MLFILIWCFYSCVGVGHGSAISTYWNRRLDLYSKTVTIAQKDPLFGLRLKPGNVSSYVSPNCARDLQIYKHDLNASKEWAVKASDAWGRVRAGVIEGNYLWLGSYDECMGIADNKADTHPDVRYCKVYIFDPGFVFYGPGPKDTGNLGACVPKSCSATDLNYFLYSIGNITFQNQNQSFIVERSWCAEKKDMGQDLAAIFVTILLTMFLLLVLLGTVYDAYSAENGKFWDTGKKTVNDANQDKLASEQQENNDDQQTSHGIEQNKQSTAASGSNTVDDEIQLQEPESRKMPAETSHPLVTQVPSKKRDIAVRLLTSFSLLRNVPAILGAGQSRDTYKCINGIRFLSMAWILLGHVHVLGITLSDVLTVANPAKLRIFKNRLSYSIIQQMNWAVEAFFVLSGLLTTVSLLKQLKRQNGKASAKMIALHIFHRFWRLSPVYYMILAAYTVYYYYLGEGPLFDQKMGDIEACRLFWWTNIFYVNNFLAPLTCMGWTWYLAIDFQFYILAPIFVILLYKKQLVGRVTLSVVFAVFVFGVSGFIAHEVNTGKLDYMTEYYVKPYTRCGSYLLGIVLGYIFFKTNCKYEMKKAVMIAGWIICLILAYTVIHVPYSDRDRGCINCAMWNTATRAAYDTLSRPVFALALCWIIFACCTGHGGVINWMLSWSIWAPLSRLTYVGYLIHPFLIELTNRKRPDSFFISDWILVIYFCGVLVLTMGISFIISLVLEVPMLSVEKVLLPRNK